jgi:hypothetical protein
MLFVRSTAGLRWCQPDCRVAQVFERPIPRSTPTERPIPRSTPTDPFPRSRFARYRSPASDDDSDSDDDDTAA